MPKTAGKDVPYRKKWHRKQAQAAGTFVPSEEQRKRARRDGATPPTPEQVKTITDALETGQFYETACALAGVSRHIGREWLRLGSRDDGPEWARVFKVEHELAVERGVAHTMNLIANAALPFTTVTKTKTETPGDGEDGTPRIATTVTERTERGDYRALAWRIERTDPKRFQARVRVEVARELEAVIEALAGELPDETFQVVCAIIARKLGNPGDAE